MCVCVRERKRVYRVTTSVFACLSMCTHVCICLCEEVGIVQAKARSSLFAISSGHLHVCSCLRLLRPPIQGDRAG